MASQTLHAPDGTPVSATLATVLERLAAAHPHLDDITWRVTLPHGGWEFITGQRREPSDPGTFVLLNPDGTEKTYQVGQWRAAVRMPGKVPPVLDDIIRRLHLAGQANLSDIINSGAWLQAQPEWLEEEESHRA